MRKALSKNYPAGVPFPYRRVPGFKPPPFGRIREVKVTYYPTTVPVHRGTRMDCPAALWRAFHNLSYEPVEVFRVAFLDSGLGLLAYEDVARGAVNQCGVLPREVFHSAVQLRASAVALLHCHPDGDLGASERDIAVTEKLRKAGDVLGIPVVDHIIVGARDYYSMRDHDWK